MDGGTIDHKRTRGREENVGRIEGVPFWCTTFETPVGQVKGGPSKWFDLCMSLDTLREKTELDI